MKHFSVVTPLQSANDAPESADPSARIPGPPVTGAHADDALHDAYSLTVSRVARLARPSVAHITVRRADSGAGKGSGFVFTPDGFLLTNSHVVHNAKEMIAAFADGAEYCARLIGEDPSTDTAVLRLEGGSTAALSLGDSRQLAGPDRGRRGIATRLRVHGNRWYRDRARTQPARLRRTHDRRCHSDGRRP